MASWVAHNDSITRAVVPGNSQLAATILSDETRQTNAPMSSFSVVLGI